MNKKGFTLIELLSVVTLIALISLLVLPNILSSINSKKGELSEANMGLLTSAADVYIGNHSGKYVSTFEASGSVYCIPIQSLVNDGVLETPIRDVNGNEINYSDVLKATYSSNTNDFSYEKVDSNNCTEFINYISRPELSSNMIPVVYDNGSWRKADVNSKWYNYLDKNWANAVVVREFKSDNSNSMSRYEYLEAKPGTVINESDILGFFVWIPRFRYQLFNSNSRISINIVFESIGSTKSNGTQSGQWLTHPAFTYNGNELSGIWVSKYEASNSDGNALFKSGLSSWSDIDYNRMNDVSIGMAGENNIYGLSGVNSHMICNSEWSAVSYLANSIYGINGSMSSSSTTTGNSTGVYNMVGNKEYVIMDANGVDDLGHSLGETSGWTSNNNSFVDNDNLYISRGGTSIFDFDKSKISGSNISFRTSIVNEDSYMDYKPKYFVNFEANDGVVSEISKEVTYGDSYGELPVPTKSGYVFKGWTGKNLFDMDNFIETYRKYQRRITEKTTFDGYDTYKVFGFLSVAGRDFHYMEGMFKENTQYTISTDIYDFKNNNYPGLIVIVNYTDGTRVQAITDSRVAGQWQSLSYTSEAGKTISFISFSYNTGFAYSYIKNFQIEEGTQKTEYEPHKLYTKDTVVQKDNVHTLYAVWGLAPELALSKETYKNVSFDDWTLSSNSSLSNGELTLGSDGAAATAVSDYIDVNNDYWYMTFDAYSTVTSSNNTLINSATWNTSYYNSSKTSVSALGGSTSNGYAPSFITNQWDNNIYWNSMEEWLGQKRYGSNVKYIKVTYSVNTSNYKAPMKLRNLKIYGQLVNSFYLINLDISNGDSIVVRKYASGSQNANYFKTSGTSFDGSQITVNSNGTYTVYIEDIMGNYALQTIEITNIG